MPKVSKKTLGELTNEQLALQGIDYVNKKNVIKELDSQCKEIRKPLEQAVKDTGRTLASGSKILIIPFADKDVHLKETLRVGKVLLPEAMDVIRENGLEECIEDVPTIREDVLERLYEEGKVTDDILQKIYAEKSSWAFSVEVKNHFDEEGID